MRQLLNERNKELAALMIKKTKQNGKLDDKDSEAYEAALARFNARANANRRRASKKNIDWESGKDARAEGHIARATRGVKKEKKGAAEKAARAHGDVKEWKRLTSNGELIAEQGILHALKALGKWGVKKLTRGGTKSTPRTPTPTRTSPIIDPATKKPLQVKMSKAEKAAADAKKAEKAKESGKAAEKAEVEAIRQTRRAEKSARPLKDKIIGGAKGTAKVAGGGAAGYGLKKTYDVAKAGSKALEGGAESVKGAAKDIKQAGSELRSKAGETVDYMKTQGRKATDYLGITTPEPKKPPFGPQQMKNTPLRTGPPFKPQPGAKTPPKKKGGWFKDKDGNWKTGAKVAGAVGGAYLAKKTLDAFKDDK